MTVNEHAKDENAGFEGEVTGLELADLVQLNGLNRFSGCIDVQFEGRRGLVFMREGEVIHAEAGTLSGEGAFYEIMSWPGGRFALQENVATTRASIKKNTSFLVLEAHRLLDERRASGPPDVPATAPAAAAPAAPPPAARPKAGTAAEVLERLRAIPGVLYAVIQGKDGGRVGDPSHEAEVLAGQALYLAIAGRRAADALQAGEVHSAVVHGNERHLVLLAVKSHLVALLVDAQAEVGAVELALRRALTSR